MNFCCFGLIDCHKNDSSSYSYHDQNEYSDMKLTLSMHPLIDYHLVAQSNHDWYLDASIALNDERLPFPSDSVPSIP